MRITKIDFDARPRTGIVQGQLVKLTAQLTTDTTGLLPDAQRNNYTYQWTANPETDINPDPIDSWTAEWVPMNSGEYEIHLAIKPKSGAEAAEILPGLALAKHDFFVEGVATGPTEVRLVPPTSGDTTPAGFMEALMQSTGELDFKNYEIFVDRVMCPYKGSVKEEQSKAFDALNKRRAAVFPGVDAYQRLKVATEVYLMLNVRVASEYKFDGFNEDKFTATHGSGMTVEELRARWNEFLKTSDGKLMLPIDNVIRNNLKEPLIAPRNGDVTACEGVLQARLQSPCFLELIWSYWHEEGMLVQTMKAITLRFQNQRASDRDPLASFDIAPLYPLSNILWGYIQDEQHRLTVLRRAYEYDHHYGLVLDGKAVPPLRSADSRSKFIEAFHNLLHTALLFYKLDDDTTKRADGFPVLNGLKEVHLLLREGMHNQFGDLPSTARMEMLQEQWILARPEMQDFLGGRAMMPYSEGWMDRVDTMKKLKGWTDVSVTYFNELAEFGEVLLTSIRHFDWSNINDPGLAVFWVRACRARIQNYVHNYRTVTGVDLSPGQTDVRLAADRYIQPSVLLRKRLDDQWQKLAAGAPTYGSPRRAAAAGAGRNGSSRVAAGQSGGRRTGAARELEFSEEIE